MMGLWKLNQLLRLRCHLLLKKCIFCIFLGKCTKIHGILSNFEKFGKFWKTFEAQACLRLIVSKSGMYLKETSCLEGERPPPPSTTFTSSSKVEKHRKHKKHKEGRRHHKKSKRHRTAFTPTQLLGLENSFERAHYLVGEDRRHLAMFLRLSETQIKVRFLVPSPKITIENPGFESFSR